MVYSYEIVGSLKRHCSVINEAGTTWGYVGVLGICLCTTCVLQAALFLFFYRPKK